MAGSGAARVTVLDWVVVGAGLLAWGSSFLPWYTDTANVSILGINQSAGPVSRDAWHAGFGAYLSVLLLVVAGVVVLVSTLGGLGLIAFRSLITLVLSVLALVPLVLRVTVPDASGGLGELDDVHLGSAFAVSRVAGVGLYLGLIAAIAAVVASLLTVRAGRTHRGGTDR
jgi:hypothetical protein